MIRRILETWFASVAGPRRKCSEQFGQIDWLGRRSWNPNKLAQAPFLEISTPQAPPKQCYRNQHRQRGSRGFFRRLHHVCSAAFGSQTNCSPSKTGEMKSPSEDPYRDESGSIVMCMHCERTLRRIPPGHETWEIVLSFVPGPQG